MAKPRGRGNGEGTIYKIESKNLWACQYTLGRDEAGKLKRKTIYGKPREYGHIRTLISTPHVVRISVLCYNHIINALSN